MLAHQHDHEGKEEEEKMGIEPVHRQLSAHEVKEAMEKGIRKTIKTK